MNNKDKPAFPIINSEGFPTLDFKFEKDANDTTIGLTKREYFAGLAMQSILSGVYSDKQMVLAQDEAAKLQGIAINEAIIKNSIQVADELLKQLES